MAEVGLVQFARVALDVAQATVPRYRTTFSKHRFTQPQLLAILCLMRYEDWTYREAEVRLWHRHRLVQMRTRVKNQMQAIALNEGMRRKKGLWSKRGRAQFESLVLAPWTTRRRQDLLELLDRLDQKIDGLSSSIQQEAEQRPEVQRLMTHPGVGSITALAFVLILGVPERFACGKQLSSYLGLIPCEESNGGRQRLGHISKQGNTLLRFLLIESAHAVIRYEPNWRRQFLHLALRRGRPIAKVAMARKLAVRLYWMWRKGWDYQQTLQFGSHVGSPKLSHGVQQNTAKLIGHPAPAREFEAVIMVEVVAE